MTTGHGEVMARYEGTIFGRARKESCKNMTRKKVEEMLMTGTFYYPSGKGFVIRT